MDNITPNSAPENPAPKKWNKKLIIAYAAVGIVALAILGLAIYNQITSHKPKKLDQKITGNQNLTLNGSPYSISNLNQQYKSDGTFNSDASTSPTSLPQ